MLLNRYYSKKLPELIRPGKVLMVYGPRQTGKTTLVRQFLNGYSGRVFQTTGEDRQTTAILASRSVDELKLRFGDLDLLFIDEAQAVADIGQALKMLTDWLPNLAVVVTGSSSFELAGQVGEPLVGRKRTLTLYPFSFGEIASASSVTAAQGRLESFLVYGSYPDVWLAEGAAEKRDVLRELAEGYLFKDIVAFESVRNADKIRKLLALVAFQVGKEVSLTELATRLGISRQTVERYLDLLEKTFVVYRVGGFSRNLRGEVTKMARYYFVDNGIMNAITGAFAPVSLRNDAGTLWENWIMAERMKYLTACGRSVNRYFWRTYTQVEIDSVEEEDGRLAAWEFKWGGKRPRVPASWKSAYPAASYEVISPESFIPFVMEPSVSVPRPQA